MFKHKPDPEVMAELENLKLEVGKELDGLNRQLAAVEAQNHLLQDQQDMIEEKLDEILKRLDSSARSIPGESKDAKAPPLEIAPGHKPWSQRKFEREQRKRDPNLANKLTRATAPTEEHEDVT